MESHRAGWHVSVIPGQAQVAAQRCDRWQHSCLASAGGANPGCWDLG
jgi:hypothetical protein